MKIRYQGKETETDAASVAAFLAMQDVKVEAAVVEYKGEILSGEAEIAAPLEDGAELNVFRIVAGG
jgi:sulfur carrier protein ThiS